MSLTESHELTKLGSTVTGEDSGEGEGAMSNKAPYSWWRHCWAE